MRKVWQIHGKSRTKIHRAWGGMKERCYNPNSEVYSHYGGRGIQVCKRWRNSFLNFYKDMGDPPPGHSLERKNNNGNYTPKNCRWATKKEQVNNRRNNIIVNYKGFKGTLKSVCERVGVNYKLVHKRIKGLGWKLEDAIERRKGNNAGLNKTKYEK